MTDMDDEAMKAMARRIAWGTALIPNSTVRRNMERAALAAIIETRDRDAALVEKLANHHHLGSLERLSHSHIAAAIRSGQQFRKDV